MLDAPTSAEADRDTAVPGLGCVAAAVNLGYSEAATRLPLGTTSTIEFLATLTLRSRDSRIKRG